MVTVILRVIGFCADTCNVMFGANHSVSTLLKDKIPNLLTVKCSCHSLALCASYACKKLPPEAEETVKLIYNHFSRSTSRRREFETFQIFADIAKHIILSPGQTRWLSLEACVNRILEQHNALKLYFTAEVFDDTTKASQTILPNISLALHIPLMEFMSYVLHEINELNTVFQSTTPMLYDMKPRIHKQIRDFALNFMQRSYVMQTDPAALDVMNSDFLLPSVDIYLGKFMFIPYIYFEYYYINYNIISVYVGPNARESLKLVQDPTLVRFLNVHARYFYQEVIKQLQTRFDFSDRFYAVVKLLEPANARKLSPSHLDDLFDRFPQLLKDVTKLNAECEWRGQSTLSLEQLDCATEDEINIMTPDVYWDRVSRLKRDGKLMFPSLMKCISFLLSMPFSNVAAEREFSVLKLIKTDHRNSLHNITVASLMRIKHWLSKTNTTAVTADFSNTKLLKKVRRVKANRAINTSTKSLVPPVSVSTLVPAPVPVTVTLSNSNNIVMVPADPEEESDDPDLA